MSFLDLLLQLRVLHVEVILILVHVQKSGNRDTVLLKYEVLFVVVHPSDQRAKVHAGFGEREAIDHSFRRHTWLEKAKVDDS